jgi:hypothetical protein
MSVKPFNRKWEVAEQRSLTDMWWLCKLWRATFVDMNDVAEDKSWALFRYWQCVERLSEWLWEQFWMSVSVTCWMHESEWCKQRKLWHNLLFCVGWHCLVLCVTQTGGGTWTVRTIVKMSACKRERVWSVTWQMQHHENECEKGAYKGESIRCRF